MGCKSTIIKEEKRIMKYFNEICTNINNLKK